MPALSIPKRLHLPFIAACVVIIVAGLKAAASIITPLAIAAFIAAINLPLLGWLRRQRVPTWLAILAIVLLDAAVLVFFGWIIFQTATELRAEFPMYLERAQTIEAAVLHQLREWGMEVEPDYYAALVQPARLLDFATTAALNVTSMLSWLLIILLYLVFILAESVIFPRKIRAVYGDNGNNLQGTTRVLKEVQRYLGLKTVVSLVSGIVIWIGASLLGVDFALFWGLLAFGLNYIPTIGSFLAAVPAVLVALLQLGIGHAIALTAVYLAVDVIIGSLADPILVGRTLRLSPIVVLVSLMFWGWVWGPTGMFLSVPLTIVLRIVLENTESGARFAALLGPPDDKTPSRFALRSRMRRKIE